MKQKYIHIDIEEGLFTKLEADKNKLAVTWGEYFENKVLT